MPHVTSTIDAARRGRRQQGSGSITWLDDARTRARLRVFTGTDPATGMPRQVSRTVTVKGPREANKALETFKAEVAAGVHGGSSSTVAQLLEEWLRHSKARGRAPRTLHEARRTIDKVLVPAIGGRQVASLTAHHLDRLYAELVDDGLAPASIRRYHAVISAALEQAVRWAWIDKNPARRARPPELPHRVVNAPTVAEVARLLQEATESSPKWGALLSLAALTGMRRGELCALRWTDVDLEACTIRVARSLYRAGDERGEKVTKSGRERLVALPSFGADVLLRWRAIAENEAVDAGVELVPDSFVVASVPDGSRPMNPDSLSSYMRRLCDELGMPSIHVHSLRHFAATELLAVTTPRDAADMLGHASPAFTMARYEHARVERQRSGAEALGALLKPVSPAALEI